MLDVGEHIGKYLAGMMFIRQTIDDGYAGVGGKTLDDLLTKGANHDDVAHPGHHLRRIFHRLAAAELAVAGIQIDRRTAELVHARFKRKAGAGGIFFEHHHQRAVHQRMVRLVILEFAFDDLRALDQIVVLREREVGKLQIVFDCHK